MFYIKLNRGFGILNGMFKYQKAINTLKKEISSGRWNPGDAFLGVKAVRERFKISHLTAVKVIDGLEALQLVESRRGSGTFIAKRHKSICFLSPAFGLAPFFPLIRKEISDLCQRNGISFEICEVDDIAQADFPIRFERAAHELIRSHPSGIIYLPSTNITPNQDCLNPSNNIDRKILTAFDGASIPVTLIDSGIDSPLEDRYDLVGVDNRAIGIKLGQHLLEQKAKRVMFVSWKSHSPNVCDRQAGLKETIRSAGIAFSTYELTKSNIKNFRRMLKSSARPDAIACSSDRIALMVLHILKQAKVAVPDDILLTGVDDTDLAKRTSPTLTTVHQPYREIARAACETLLNRIARPTATPRHLMIATTLVARASTRRTTKPGVPNDPVTCA